MRRLTLALIAAMAFGAASTTVASDADGNYSDYSADCSALNAALDKPDVRSRAEAQFTQFTAGFVSAFNLANPDTWDILGEAADLEPVITEGKAYCRAHPDESWSAAIDAALSPRVAKRVRTRPPGRG